MKIVMRDMKHVTRNSSLQSRHGDIATSINCYELIAFNCQIRE